MKTKLVRVLFNSVFVIFFSYSVIFLLGMIGVFFNKNIANTQSIFLFIKVAVMILSCQLIRFTKNKYFPKPKKVKKDSKVLKKGKVPVKAISVVLIFSILGLYNPNRDIITAVGNAKFSIVSWEIKSLLSELASVMTNSGETAAQTNSEQILLVTEYFDLAQTERLLLTKQERFLLSEEETQKLRAATQKRVKIENEVELIISGQIQSVIEDLGVYNPINKGDVFFPPLLFKFQLPPKLLTISYRNKLEVKTTILLKSNLTIEQIELVEARLEALGWSAYIRQAGGVSLFPTVVYPDSLQHRLNTIAHEWLHTYMVFTPLGLARFGGNTNERQTIEETVATIFGNEIGAEVWRRFYLPYLSKITLTKPAPDTEQRVNTFSRDQFLIETRQQVEKLLSEGRIDEAEAYMRQRRNELEENGHYERKINQAYFVANGYYATNPVYQGGQNGLGEKLLELRQRSNSLSQFLKVVVRIKNLKDLEQELQKLR